MAFFASCWSIIELHLLPDGFMKWFYLSFYIHPLLLVACQFFLRLKALKEFLSVILFHFLSSITFLCICIYNFCTSAAVYCFSFIREGSDRVHSRETFKPAESSDDEDYQIFRSFSFSCQVTSTFELKDVPAQTVNYKEEDEHEYREASMDFDDLNEEPKSNRDIDLNTNESSCFSSGCCSNLPEEKELVVPSVKVNEEDSTDMPSPIVTWSWPQSIPPDGGTSYSLEEEAPPESDLDKYIPPPYKHSLAGLDMNEDSASRYGTGFYSSELDWTDNEPTVDVSCDSGLPLSKEPDTRKNSDPFYDKYTERMRWFDLVSYERTCGISAIVEKQFDSATRSKPYISWGKTVKKRLLKSIESDFELAYVAQMCLSWEALHHQYRRIHELLLLSSSCPRIIRVSGHTRLVTEFQNFQVLVERFLEDERCGGKRHLKFVQGRLSFKSLLQVPGLSGNLEAEEDLKEVAKALEKCITAFCLLVKTDEEKSWWKVKSSLWSYPPVEDPRDLKLFHELTAGHRKKVLLLKDIQGRGKCWIEQGGLTGEYQRKEVLFAMIDLKLVSRVLQMATISSSQLKWCQSKLDDVIFQDGKVMRGSTCLLFPAS